MIERMIYTVISFSLFSFSFYFSSCRLSSYFKPRSQSHHDPSDLAGEDAYPLLPRTYLPRVHNFRYMYTFSFLFLPIFSMQIWLGLVTSLPWPHFPPHHSGLEDTRSGQLQSSSPTKSTYRIFFTTIFTTGKLLLTCLLRISTV